MIRRQVEWANCVTNPSNELKVKTAPNENLQLLRYRREMGGQQKKKKNQVKIRREYGLHNFATIIQT